MFVKHNNPFPDSDFNRFSSFLLLISFKTGAAHRNFTNGLYLSLTSASNAVRVVSGESSARLIRINVSINAINISVDHDPVKILYISPSQSRSKQPNAESNNTSHIHLCVTSAIFISSVFNKLFLRLINNPE